MGPFYVENLNFPAIKWGEPFPRPKKLIFLIGRPIENDAFEMVNVLDLLK